VSQQISGEVTIAETFRLPLDFNCSLPTDSSIEIPVSVVKLAKYELSKRAACSLARFFFENLDLLLKGTTNPESLSIFSKFSSFEKWVKH
jgi:hypothetical protein